VYSFNSCCSSGESAAEAEAVGGGGVDDIEVSDGGEGKGEGETRGRRWQGNRRSGGVCWRDLAFG